MEAVKVIDVSKHNGTIDFEAVKLSGIYGVIIRAGYGRSVSQKDPAFEKYYRDAKEAGLTVGTYWYSYAESPAEAEIEAAAFCKAIEGKSFELPVYYDIEEKKHLSLGLKVCSEMADRFCRHLEEKGYFAGIYSFDAFYANFSDEVKRKYSKWVARIENVKPVRCTDYDLWQYTWKASVKGIAGECDCSYCYKDFPAIIKKAGLNKTAEVVPKYNVTARMANLDKDYAAKVSEQCQKLGMTVVISED